MTFTYVAGTPDDRTRIRARIGDTDSTAPATQRLEDEEIADFITTEGTFRTAAIACARALAAKFFRLATQKTVGQLSLAFQRRAEGLLDIVKELKESAALGARPLAGGMSLSEKEADLADGDLVQPANRRGDFDNPLGHAPIPNFQNEETTS